MKDGVKRYHLVTYTFCRSYTEVVLYQHLLSVVDKAKEIKSRGAEKP